MAMFGITGTPGTGKKSISPIVAERLRVQCLSLHELASSYHLVRGASGDVDVDKLRTRLRRGLPKGIGGLVDVVKSPMYATAVGLVLYGAHQQESRPYFKIREENVYRKVKNRMKEWLGEIF